MRTKVFVRGVIVLTVLALVAAACGKADKKKEVQKQGGSIVVGAEQWPECLNMITSCANASWMHWTTTQYVLPKAMELDPQGNFVGSPLLVETPTAANGGIKENPFVITFKIRPEAKWDDGTDITSADFEFTRQAILKTKTTLSTLGYDKIKKINTSDPKTAVITFTEPYADWWDLFGGASTNGYVLKQSAFGGKVDLKDEMKDGITFSGGPWKLQSWTKQQGILVRNSAYWAKDRVPLLDQVTFVPREDQSTEVTALLSGEVLAIFPQPKSPDFRQQLEKSTVVKSAFGAGTTYEGLWLNLDAFPLKEKAVREALGYAVDRQAVVDFLIKPNSPQATVLNCAGWVPNVGKWCDNTDFARFTYDPAKAKKILQDAGWKLGAGGIFAKGGKRLSILYSTTAGNKGREDTQALLKEKVKKAGIELKIQNYPAGDLFENRLPKRNFVMAEYANVASPDPSLTSTLASDQIPSKANNFKGQNWLGWRNAEATKALKDSDKTIDPAKRLELIRKVGDREAQDLPWIPLYQKPLITAWRADRLGGPIDLFTSSPLSSFWNMYDWFLK